MNEAVSTKRRRLVVGNWKMNGSLRENADLLTEIVSGWQNDIQTEIVICPSFPYLQTVNAQLVNTSIRLGAQNVAEEEAGAFTGEVSARMLADLDCKFVIIGHNERRRLRGETDEQIIRKFKNTQAVGLIPILCVGESLAKREAGEYLDIIAGQLTAVINQVGLAAFKTAIIAYEPVWAVGTGKTATPEQAQEVHRFIRKQLCELGSEVRIVYGGSVNAHNAKQLFECSDIDGALLGGASLNAKDFLTICNV